jgi:3-hydroxy-3-methylglutaryl CoA synthase/uncharacterized OB-fold protein
MMDIYLTSLAAYRPGRCLSLADVAKTWGSNAEGELRVCGPDEDAVTLAVAVASTLPLGEVDACSTVILARPSAPHGSGDGAAVVAAALGLSPRARTLEVAGSDRCFSAALDVAVALVRSGGDESVLVVVSDDTRTPPGSPAEQRHGHGSAAVIVSGTPGAVRWLGSDSVSVPVADRWYGADGARRDAGERFLALTVVPKLLANLSDKSASAGASPRDVVVALSDPRAADRVAAALGAQTGPTREAWMHGAPGSVLPASLLVEAVASAVPGEIIDLVAFGSGVTRSSVEVLDVMRAVRTVEPAGPNLPYAMFLRSGGALGPPVSGPPASPVSAWRDLDATLQLMGGACAVCGATYYPSRPACASCGAHDSAMPVRLVGEATVVTSTTDHLVAGVNPGTPESPTTMVVAETDAGARLFLPSVHGSFPAIGSRVRTVLRLAHQGGGFRNYHWRFAPVMSPEPGDE